MAEPSGTQEIGVGDTETLTMDDPGGIAVDERLDDPAAHQTGSAEEAIDVASSADKDDPSSPEPFADAFENDEDLTSGAAVSIGEDKDDPSAPPASPAALVEVERPPWLPAEIDPKDLSESELLRLRVVHQSALATNELAPQEAALVERYRLARAQMGEPSTAGAAGTVVPTAGQPYQPQSIDIPDGYENDVAFKGLVDGFNRQNAETAHLLNSQAQQIATLGQAVHQTSVQATETGQIAAWNAFLNEHPEAKDPAIQQKIAEQIRFWSDPNKDARQFWAGALQNILPRKKAAPNSSPSMDPATKRARSKRALAASAAHPTGQSLQPAERTAALDNLHEEGADFGAFMRAEFPNG